MNPDPGPRGEVPLPPGGPCPVPPTGPGPAGDEPPRRVRRTRVAILLTFLGVFALLLIVFRAVLFPFLMAIFIAYLIEPVVAAFTRAPVFGVRWTRGPTIVLMYAIVLTAIFFTTSCAVHSISGTVRSMTVDVNQALAERGEAAYFEAEPKDPPFDQDVRIPAGTRVVLVPHLSAPAASQAASEASGVAGPDSPQDAPPEPAPPVPALPPSPPAPPAVFETYHDALLHAGESRIRIILKPTGSPVPPGRVHGDVLNPEGVRLLDDAPLPAGRRLTVRGAPNAKGLELWLEKNLIGRIVENLRAVGYHAEPTTLREFTADQAEMLNANVRGLLARSANLALEIGRSLYMFLLILMLTAFIVMDRKRISAFFASLPPEQLKPEYASLIRYIDRGLAGVIRGQLVICAVNGLLTYVGLVILGVRGAALLSLVAGVLSLIPIFGTIVSSIPIVLVAATSSIPTGLFALGWIGLIHLLEANLLNPLIMGSHANMHPVVIVFALLAGEHSFGIWGALLAVPTMSIIQSCFLFYRHEIEGIPSEHEEAHGAWLRNLFGRVFRRGSQGRPAAPSGTGGTIPAAPGRPPDTGAPRS